MNIRSALLLCFCSSFLGSCTTIHETISFIPGIPDPRNTAIREIVLEATSDANNASATRIDFLFVFDATLVNSLPGNSPEWFTNRELLMHNHAGDMVVASIGITPGTTATLELPDGYRDANVVIAYADYIGRAGQKWYRVLNAKAVKVILTESGITFQNASE